MKFGLWKLIKVAYAELIRPVLFKAIDNPDVEWDDFLMTRLDDLFDYKEE
ncbi:unnamed protein product [marine sediment metagenome]|uniref:Uncharacterized protein n=1 Tax=marine sediment metagenome TaxID=412755 RepID=X1LUM3_9ZZZZ